MNELVFVYGTLRMGCGNNYLLRNARYLGERLTKDFYHMTVSGCVPFIDVAPLTSNFKAQVKGDLFLVTDEETMEDLDALEGHPDWYCRKVMELASGEPAWIYLNDAAHENPYLPNEYGLLVCPK